MIELVDTHAHLDDEAFHGDLDGVVQRAGEAGVGRIIAVGTTRSSSCRVAELAARYRGVWAAVGIQPNDVAEAAPGDWEAVVELARTIPKVVAIGETGIDHYWDRTPHDLQRDYFERHLELAAELDLPVIIHMRESGRAIVEQFGRFVGRRAVAGVMHSFTGDKELLDQCLDLGLAISFAGMVTFKKSGDLREVARRVPDDRLLVETDAPYLSPEPLRGRRPNEPSRIVHTARCLAEVRGVTLEELAERTTTNACRLFRLPNADRSVTVD